MSDRNNFDGDGGRDFSNFRGLGRVTEVTSSAHGTRLVLEGEYRHAEGRGRGGRWHHHSWEFPQTSTLQSMPDMVAVATVEVNLRRQTWGFAHLDSFPVSVPVRRMVEAGELPTPSSASTLDVRPTRLSATSSASAAASTNNDFNNNNGVTGNTKRKAMGPDADGMEDDYDTDDDGSANKRLCRDGNIGNTPTNMSAFYDFGNGGDYTVFDVPPPGRAMSWVLGRQVIPPPEQEDEMEVQSGEDGLPYLFNPSGEQNM